MCGKTNWLRKLNPFSIHFCGLYLNENDLAMIIYCSSFEHKVYCTFLRYIVLIFHLHCHFYLSTHWILERFEPQTLGFEATLFAI